MPTEEEDEEDARFRHAGLMLRVDQEQHVPTDEQGGPLFRCSFQENT